MLHGFVQVRTLNYLLMELKIKVQQQVIHIMEIAQVMQKLDNPLMVGVGQFLVDHTLFMDI